MLDDPVVPWPALELPDVPLDEPELPDMPDALPPVLLEGPDCRLREVSGQVSEIESTRVTIICGALDVLAPCAPVAEDPDGFEELEAAELLDPLSVP